MFFLWISPSPCSYGLYIWRCRSANAISHHEKEKPPSLATSKASPFWPVPQAPPCALMALKRVTGRVAPCLTSSRADSRRRVISPLADLVSVRAVLASIGNDVMVENFPNPNMEERVCFVPLLLRGLGFPIHPFLRGLMEFYDIQLHNLTPHSILHISGFVALCELFLGIEAHFEFFYWELWGKPPQHIKNLLRRKQHLQ